MSDENGIELYSERQLRTSGVLDIVTYVELPLGLRWKIHYAVSDLLGPENKFNAYETTWHDYVRVVSDLRRRYGVGLLSTKSRASEREWEDLKNHILYGDDINRVFDVVELVARFAKPRHDGFHRAINKAFLFSGEGYRLEGPHVIRIDGSLLHSEAVKPALFLLSGAKWQGASDEFFNAYDHYRHNRHEEANVEALKALESTLKIISTEKGWQFDPRATFKDLTNICFDNNLIPPLWESMMTHLRCLLESSVPTGRNKLGGHGQGPQVRDVPDYVTGYILHMTASAIVFLRQAFDASNATN